jgi:coenzyme F420 hydrogenase subunit beta
MDWLLRYADKLFGIPAQDKIEQYLGAWDALFFGYAKRKELRTYAASGGMVSALLVYLLDQKVIQGALVSRITVEGGQIRAMPYIARTPNEILQGQSSIYMEFPWMQRAKSLLRTTEGSLAVVGLPCHINNLRRMERHDQDLAHKVKVRVALVCGRSSSKKLLLKVLAKKGIYEDDVENIRFREGHWRGQMHVWLKNGSEVVFPFKDFSLYRNLHFYCEKRCLYCEDPLGDNADIVCGDVWLEEMRQEAIKHSLVISRNPQLTQWVQEMEADGYFVGKAISSTTLVILEIFLEKRNLKFLI